MYLRQLSILKTKVKMKYIFTSLISHRVILSTLVGAAVSQFKIMVLYVATFIAASLGVCPIIVVMNEPVSFAAKIIFLMNVRIITKKCVNCTLAKNNKRTQVHT